ncbi:precorrin-2 dehydrogenase [Scopulibacillus darangshiensis]|uniref:precorrin-2 dehydrogenase n=1 Tax=Scopulibacillus darangshiensis TaxID=442528 RepID=A0A4R2NQ12_9BACL|nr:NAD(P)-binding protein [Scopulibacillus darangshiensis]TCP23458.1 precorrin-2 dehydrogenase [Scopulibacillus darangshiensis]
MNSYPIMLDIRGKKAVVIGGGRVAFRKIRVLLDAGALVTVISPEAIEQLAALSGNGKLKWVQRVFESEDISDAFIVIAATNDANVNSKAAQIAEEHQLINVCDQPDLGNFQLPAVFNKGRLSITVSTAGASPLLARQIRDDLAGNFDEHYEDYLDFLFACRERLKLKSLHNSRKNQLLKQLLQPGYRSPDRQKEVMMNFEAFCRSK